MIIKCPNCHNEMDDIYEICPSCGCIVSEMTEKQTEKKTKQKKGKNTVLVVAICFAVFFVLVAAVLVIFLSGNNEPEINEPESGQESSENSESDIYEEVILPDIMYMNKNDAKMIIEDAGYSTAFVTEENPDFAEDTVIGYVYDYVENTVVITLAFGAPEQEGETVVPDISGKTVEEAMEILKEAGLFFERGSLDVADKEIEKGRIKNQYPQEGKTVSKGDKVSVVVSSGKYFTMPDLTGKDIAVAKKILEPYEIEIIFKAVLEDFEGFEFGTIFEQSTKEGTETEAGSKIVLMVYVGSFEGLKEKEAKEIAESCGFAFESNKEYSDDYKSGEIIFAYEEEGTIIAAVSKGKKPEAPKPVESKPEESKPESESSSSESGFESDKSESETESSSANSSSEATSSSEEEKTSEESSSSEENSSSETSSETP